MTVRHGICFRRGRRKVLSLLKVTRSAAWLESGSHATPS
jgi:hypothetical protein